MLWADGIGLFLLVGICFPSSAAVSPPSARSISETLAHITLDAEQTYRVRDLRLNRGGVKIYLNDGILSFAAPINGKVVAAAFTTLGVEAGDAEVLALPPNRSERTSIARYTRSPTLNEHFGTAVFFFSDGTLQECLSQLQNTSHPHAPLLAEELKPTLDPVLRNLYPNIDLSLLKALLDEHSPQEGFFYATFGGRDLGRFSFLFDPTNRESVTLGQMGPDSKRLQLWSSYRGEHMVPPAPQTSRFSEYRIRSKIADSLRLSAHADFSFRCDGSAGRVLRFDLSDRLSVTAAAIDQQPVEFYERTSGSFLLVAAQPLSAGQHEISVSYEGDVIRHTNQQTYFVEERNTWYPQASNTAATFDLIFECPEALRLVSTGELVSEVVEKGIRIVHRRTPVPQTFAGFNLGDYRVQTTELAPYQVEVFSNRSEASEADLGPKTAAILKTYSDWWTTLPFHGVAVSPIAGYFGQGFPGLIYLSDVSYIKQESRPAHLRNPRFDSFFSDMLLPHEVAHQWWGNLVVGADYRVGWLSEAMATHSALEYLAQHDGERARDLVLAEYKQDLQGQREGKSIEGLGPVDFGVRLIDSDGKEAWHTIVYEKGAWILRMLQTRLGEERWREFQLQLLTDFATRPITNEAFRQAVAAYLPVGQPDRDLQIFFDTWVYSTGIPRLAMSKEGSRWDVEVSAVENDFTADIPIDCQARSGGPTTVRWIRATPGSNVLPPQENDRVCKLPPANRFLFME